MKIHAKCANGHRLLAPQKLAGKQLTCPKCSALVIVPEIQGRLPESSAAVPRLPIDPFADIELPEQDSASAHNHDTLGAFDESWKDEGFSHATVPSGQSFYSAPATNQIHTAEPKAGRTSMALIVSIVGGVVGLCCLVALAFVSLRFFLAPTTTIATSPEKTKSSQAESKDQKPSAPQFAPAHPVGLVESAILRAELHKHLQKGAHEFSVIDVERWIRQRRERSFSGYLMVDQQEDELLKAGQSYDTTLRKLRLLSAGLELFAYSPTGVTTTREDFTPTPAGDRVYADHLVTIWRGIIEQGVTSPKIDKDACKLIREIEDVCFGEDSLFQPSLKRLTASRAELLRLHEQFPKLAQAFADFELQYGQLPDASGFPALKSKGLSWRVALLPFLGHTELYSKFHLDEPWDSPHNIQLVNEIPEAFQTHAFRFSRGPLLPDQRAMIEKFGGIDPEQAKGLTSYHLIVGPNTIFDGKKRKIQEIHGSDKKMLFVVLDKHNLVEWTKPGGHSAKPKTRVSGFFAESYVDMGVPYCTFSGEAKALQSVLNVELDRLVQPNIEPLRVSEFEQFSPDILAAPSRAEEEHETRKSKIRERINLIERKF